MEVKASSLKLYVHTKWCQNFILHRPTAVCSNFPGKDTHISKSGCGYYRFVINVPGEDGEDNYVQAVKVEKCIRQGESCNIASSGYETTVCRYTSQ